MAEDNLTVGVLNLQILRDLDELFEKPPIAAAVMITLNQKYLPVQLVKDRNRFLHITPEHIAKNLALLFSSISGYFDNVSQNSNKAN